MELACAYLRTYSHKRGIARSNMTLDGHHCTSVVCARGSERSRGRVCGHVVREVTVLDFEQRPHHADGAPSSGVVSASIPAAVALVIFEATSRKFHVIMVPEYSSTVET